MSGQTTITLKCVATRFVACLLIASAPACAVRTEVKREPVAPAVPPALPLVGPQTNDEDGYPRAEVDEVRLLELMRARQFRAVTAILEHLQDAFEADYRKERWVAQAFAIFYSDNEKELGPLLVEWGAAEPGSFAPFAARGAHFLQLGWSRRGKAPAADTSHEKLAAMEEMHERAAREFVAALSIRPRAMVAHSGLISIAMNEPRETLDRVFEAADRACPDCLLFRVTHLQARRPRWGGSYEEMAAFAEAAQRRSRNPKLRYLKHYVLLDMAEVALLNREPALAVQLVDRLVAAEPMVDSLLLRAKGHQAQKNHHAAIADLDAAIARQVRPDPLLLWPRAASLTRVGQFERAVDDLLAARRPTSFDNVVAAHELPRLNAILEHGDARLEAKDYDAALYAFRQAMRLDPESSWVVDRYHHAYRRGRSPEVMVTEIEARLEKDPDNFELYKSLEAQHHILLRFPERVRVWDRFLARNPNVAAARYARAKAALAFPQRDPAGRETARQDLRFACRAGIANACRMEKALAERDTDSRGR
jgi:tetratricopeptide (TPR) repeat protein